MTRIETVFGAVLVIVLLVIGAYAMTSGKRSVQAGMQGASVVAAVPTTSAGSACACYEGAYETALGGAASTGTLYEAGYGACHERSGRTGGQAWTAGWKAGAEGRSSKRSCKAIGLNPAR
jgi:hypothetical protein